MNKVITIGAIILIVISVGYFVWKGKSSSSGEVKTESNINESIPVNSGGEKPVVQKENIVVYTDSGFSPNKLEISVGSIVIFKNESSDLMWVASAPHPTHTNYPAFDAKKGYEKDIDYSFTFDKAGEFKYHDHLNPSRFGAIIVK